MVKGVMPWIKYIGTKRLKPIKKGLAASGKEFLPRVASVARYATLAAIDK
jgi:hypothetical protein